MLVTMKSSVTTKGKLDICFQSLKECDHSSIDKRESSQLSGIFINIRELQTHSIKWVSDQLLVNSLLGGMRTDLLLPNGIQSYDRALPVILTDPDGDTRNHILQNGHVVTKMSLEFHAQLGKGAAGKHTYVFENI